MSSKTWWGMQHLNENLLCAVKCDATGPDPDVHELIEVCVLPLDFQLKIHAAYPLFNMRIRPENIDDIDYKFCRLNKSEIAKAINEGYTRDKVADMLEKWYEGMGIKDTKRILPLGYNWPIDRALLINWLGPHTFKHIFSEDYRDVLQCAHFINDKRAMCNEPVVFNKQFLPWLAKKLDVVPMDSGSCQSDALAISQIYRKILVC